MIRGGPWWPTCPYRATVTTMSSGPPDDDAAARERRRVSRNMSVEERKALAATLPKPDKTPLTAEEKAVLRERLNNRRPGERLNLSFREKAARWELGIIRSREAVVEMYQQVQAEYRELRMAPDSTEMGAGVLAAIEWCTGVTQQAPVTGEASQQFPPSTEEMSREEEVASEIAEGGRQHRRSRSFAVGVEHTIRWLLARTTQRPWGRLYDEPGAQGSM